MLFIGQPDELCLPFGDLRAEDRAQIGRRVEERLQECDSSLTRRTQVGTLAGNEAEHRVDGGARARRVAGEKPPVVEDEIRLDVRAEQAEVVAGALEIDVGEGDRPARDRVPPRRRVGKILQLGKECMEVVPSLVEGARVQLVLARPPAAAAVPCDLAGFDLDDEDPPSRVGNDEVGFPIAESAMASCPPDPGHVRVEVVLRRERGAHALEHEVFGCGTGVHGHTRRDTALQRWRPRSATTSVKRLVPLGYWGEPHLSTIAMVDTLSLAGSAGSMFPG